MPTASCRAPLRSQQPQVTQQQESLERLPGRRMQRQLARRWQRRAAPAPDSGAARCVCPCSSTPPTRVILQTHQMVGILVPPASAATNRIAKRLDVAASYHFEPFCRCWAPGSQSIVCMRWPSAGTGQRASRAPAVRGVRRPRHRQRRRHRGQLAGPARVAAGAGCRREAAGECLYNAAVDESRLALLMHCTGCTQAAVMQLRCRHAPQVPEHSLHQGHLQRAGSSRG
jgi:hypothetical protein